jgi:hypothetical protein
MFSDPLGLVVVVRIEVYGSKIFEKRQLFVAPHVLFQGLGHRFLFCTMAATPARFFNQAIVESKVGCHV